MVTHSLPLRDAADRAHLVEGLVGAAAIRVDDLRPPATRHREHAIAFGLLDNQAGKEVRDAGAVARHAHAQAGGEPCIRAGHVRGAGLVPRRDDLDAQPVQRRVEAEIRAVNDAEDPGNAFGLEDACQDFPAAQLRHWFFCYGKASRDYTPDHVCQREQLEFALLNISCQGLYRCGSSNSYICVCP